VPAAHVKGSRRALFIGSKERAQILFLILL